MAEIKLIALDMDGTLLNEKDDITMYTRQMIDKAIAKGVYVVLSTGRWLGTCYSYAESLNLDSYLITSNGAEVWTTDKKLIERHLLNPLKVRAMYDIARKIGMYVWIVSPERIYFDESPNDFESYKWLKFGCISYEKSNLDKFIKIVSGFEGVELTNSTPHNVEVNVETVNKAHALRKIVSDLGLSMNHVMAVGDGLNDLKMIQASGVGIAMGNAQEVVKNAADYVTDTHINDGVAKAIKIFI